MRNYFKSISYTLAESARIDGASELRIFAGIFLPISLPGLATAVLSWTSSPAGTASRFRRRS